MAMDDRFQLQRFVDAQQPVYETVLGELRAGRRRSHWIWFIFPQIAGLGHSMMAHKFALSSLDEAAAYLHPVLGLRLRECSLLVAGIEARSICRNLRLSRRYEIPLVDDAVRTGGARGTDLCGVPAKILRREPDPQTLARL